MSLLKPLVVAFSQDQLNGPVAERIRSVERALSYLEHEGVQALPDAPTAKPRGLAEELSTFLKTSFYLVADAKRHLLEGGEVPICLKRIGLQEFGYVTSGEIARAGLTEGQRVTLSELGFETREAIGAVVPAAESSPPFRKIELRRRSASFTGVDVWASPCLRA